MAYDNEMRGALFPEDRSRYNNPSGAPSYTGYVQIDGVRYRLACWPRTTKSGGKMLSIAVSESKQQPTTETTEEDFVS